MANTKKKTNAAQDVSQQIKKYRTQIKELISDVSWIDESAALEYDEAIHMIAKKLNSAKHRILFSKN